MLWRQLYDCFHDPSKDIWQPLLEHRILYLGWILFPCSSNPRFTQF